MFTGLTLAILTFRGAFSADAGFTDFEDIAIIAIVPAATTPIETPVQTRTFAVGHTRWEAFMFSASAMLIALIPLAERTLNNSIRLSASKKRHLALSVFVSICDFPLHLLKD